MTEANFRVNEDQKLENEEETKILLEKGDYSSFEEFYRPQQANQKKKSNEFISIFNVINTIVGAGILTLPFFTSKIGLVFSLSLVIFVGILNGFTLYILVKCKNMSASCEYVEIAKKALGRNWDIFCKALIIIHNSGMQVIYIIVFSTTMTQTFSKLFVQECSGEQAKFYCNTNFFILCAAPFIIPFIFKKTTEKLKFASFLGVFAHMVFCLILYINFFIKWKAGNLAKVSAFPESKNLLLHGLSMIPSVFVAYHCHINFFPIINSLKEPTDKKTLRVISVSIFFCIVIYISVALSGVYCFGKDTKENFLQSFDIKEIGAGLYYTVNISFGLAVLFVYPMVFFKARDHLQEIFGVEGGATEKRKNEEQTQNSKNSQNESESEKEQLNQSEIQRRKALIVERKKLAFKFFSIAYFLSIIGITILSQSYFMAVFSIVGLLGVTFVAYIGPMLFYIFLFKKAGRRPNFTYYCSWFSLGLIIIVTIISFICSLYVEVEK